jgi:hypothetical protein
MLFDVNTAEDRWAQAKHPLLGFMCHTHHPDITLGGQRRQNVPRLAMSAFPAQGAAFPM